MIKKYNIFLEAFQSRYKDIALKKIVSYIENKTKLKWYGYYEMFHVKKETIELDGKLYITFTDLAIRLNWIKGDRDEIHSIDLWQSFKFDKKPDYTLNLNGNSIMQVIDDVVEFILNPKVINENKQDELEDYKKKLSRARSEEKKSEYRDIIARLEVEISENETTTTNSSEQASQIVKLDPKMDVFDAISYSTKQVARGHSNSLLITGQSGVGKTHDVTDTLAEMGLKEDVDYIRMSGDISGPGLYESLFINRNRLLVFDDCDAVFDDKDGINFLAAALDTYKRRVISNMKKTYFNSIGMDDAEIQERYESTGKLPNKFVFSGRIIFISNRSKDQFDPKFLTRTIHIPVALTKDELTDRMSKIVQKILPEMPLFKRMEAFDYLLNLLSTKKYPDGLNIRTLIHSINIRCNSDNEDTVVVGGEYQPVWKMLIKQYVV